jgi:hypothetical protein
MRSQYDKARSRRTTLTLPGAADRPASAPRERALAERFSLCWRSPARRGRPQLRSFAPFDELMIALERLRRRDGVRIRARTAA